MANLGQLVVNLEANIARFTSDMGRASQATEQAMGRINAVVDKAKVALGALGVGISLGAIVDETNRVLDSLAALDDMAQKTGSSVETLSKLSKVASFTGTDLGAVDGMLVKLSKNLVDVDDKGNKTAKALSAIGLSSKDIKDLDPAEVFVQVASKLQGYEDGANKVALVTDLMGKSAADLLPYMNDVAESIDKFEGDSAEAAAQAAAFQDQLGLVRVKYDELKTSIVVAALPAANAFLSVLKDTKREAGLLAKDNSMLTWADDTAIVLARVVDRATLVSGALGVVVSSLRGVAKEAQVVASLNPVVMAYTKLEGGDPMAEYKKAAAESDKVWADVRSKIDAFSNISLTATEEATIRAIAEQKNARGLAVLGGMVGLNDIPPGGGRTELNYRSGDDKDEPKKDDKAWTRAAAMERMVTAAIDETLAIQNTVTATAALEAAEAKRMDRKIRDEQQAATAVDQIRQSLLSDVELEQSAYDSRIQQLQDFGALRVDRAIEVNALIEAETARHERAKAEMESAYRLQSLGAIGDTADQMYNLLKQSGEKQSALARAAFVASKAIAVAEIIVQTNLAAAKAEGQLGIFGLPASAVIMAAGYARAAMVAGTAIASAEGGYDIPAGVNPVTQLHEKEMVLPKAQAEVIRGLASNGGAGGGGGITQTINISIDGKTDMAENQKLIRIAVAQGNADLVDRLSRAGKI